MPTLEGSSAYLWKRVRRGWLRGCGNATQDPRAKDRVKTRYIARSCVVVMCFIYAPATMWRFVAVCLIAHPIERKHRQHTGGYESLP